MFPQELRFLKEAGINLEAQNMIQRLLLFLHLLHLTANCLILTSNLHTDKNENWMSEIKI